MKHKPHKFPFRSALCVAAVSAVALILVAGTGPLAAQEAASSTDTDAAAPAPRPGSVVPDLQAGQLLKEARERLESLNFMQCSLHESVHLSDLRFYARGKYSQASGNRVRLDFAIYPVRGLQEKDKPGLSVDGTPEDPGKQKPTGELTQVSNGSVLWSYWRNGDSSRLSRRNIREILEAAEQEPGFDSTRLMEDLGAGGLQALLGRLEVGMEFGKVREEQHGPTRLLVASGRWTQKSREEYFQLKDPQVPLPDWIPDYVRVYIDADARLPRRIQYLKKHPDPQVKQIRPLITMDFRDVTLNDTVDESLFEFSTPDGVVELDMTAQTIGGIKRAVSPSAQQSPAAPEAGAAPAETSPEAAASTSTESADGDE